jgi:hypothetical protein
MVDIPAVVREITDENALELMLMENFQRENVHPMEEAAGFAALRKHNNISVQGIADKIGKNWHYVADRLKLSGLIPELQQAYYEGKFKYSEALELAILAPAVQLEWHSGKMETHADESTWPTNNIARCKGELKTAPFDKEDETLVPKMGKCSGCVFNTATSQLFPDDSDAPRCLNKICFGEKSMNTVRRLVESGGDSIVWMVNRQPSAEVKKLLEGVEFRDYYSLRAEEAPLSLEECLEENDLAGEWLPDDSMYDDKKEFDEAKADAIKQHEKQMEDWLNKDWVSSGYKKGIYIDNDFTIMECWVMKNSLNKPAGTSSSSNSVHGQKVSVKNLVADVGKFMGESIPGVEKSGLAKVVAPSKADIEAGISQAETDIKNTKDLCEEKIFQEVKLLLKAPWGPHP